MKRISKEHRKAFDVAIYALRYAETEVEDAREALASAIEKYNERLEDVREAVNAITGSIEDYMSERSEAWQEGDKAQAFQSWLDSWNELDFSDLTEPDEIDFGINEALESAQFDLPED